MRFILQRYRLGLSKRKHLLALVLIPIAAFLILKGLIPDRFVVTQKLALPREAPLSISSSPVDFESLGETLSHPDQFFRDSFALRDLEQLVEIGGSDQPVRVRMLYSVVGRSMSLGTPAVGEVEVRYQGDDHELGEALVTYYSNRLLRKADEGMVRFIRESGNPPPGMVGEPEASLIDGLRFEAEASFWREDRLNPLLYTTLFSLLAVLLLIGIVEWTDPSFKSEREVGRYLGVPVLGALPNLSELGQSLLRAEKNN